MAYVDGFVAAVPADKKLEYIEHVKKMAPLFKELGVSRVVECWGDDVPDGEVTDFRKAVQAVDSEVVVFSWLEWPGKEVRDSGMQKMQQDPRFETMMQTMPMDGKRLIFGGFQPILDL